MILPRTELTGNVFSKQHSTGFAFTNTDSDGVTWGFSPHRNTNRRVSKPLYYLNQWQLVYWRIYTSFGLNELIPGNFITNRSLVGQVGSWVLFIPLSSLWRLRFYCVLLWFDIGQSCHLQGNNYVIALAAVKQAQQIWIMLLQLW